MNLLAIDPGNIESAWVIWDGSKILAMGKEANEEIRRAMNPNVTRLYNYSHVAIELIGHYGKGMPAGREVFDTCIAIGRFQQIAEQQGIKCDLVLRGEVKMHLCGSMRAKDGNVIQALKDKLGDKGTKANPGPTYGCAGDVWQALGLAVTWMETRPGCDDFS